MYRYFAVCLVTLLMVEIWTSRSHHSPPYYTPSSTIHTNQASYWNHLSQPETLCRTHWWGSEDHNWKWKTYQKLSRLLSLMKLGMFAFQRLYRMLAAIRIYLCSHLGFLFICISPQRKRPGCICASGCRHSPWEIEVWMVLESNNQAPSTLSKHMPVQVGTWCTWFLFVLIHQLSWNRDICWRQMTRTDHQQYTLLDNLTDLQLLFQYLRHMLIMEVYWMDCCIGRFGMALSSCSNPIPGWLSRCIQEIWKVHNQNLSSQNQHSHLYPYRVGCMFELNGIFQILSQNQDDCCNISMIELRDGHRTLQVYDSVGLFPHHHPLIANRFSKRQILPIGYVNHQFPSTSSLWTLVCLLPSTLE